MLFNKTHFIRALRLSIALLITFAIISYYNIAQGDWALITNAVVLFDNATVGGVLNRSYLRFMATFLSALYSLVFIYLFYNNVIIDILALVFGTFMYAYFYMDSKKSYLGVLGTVTLAIMLINYNDLQATILRPANITLGIIVALFVLIFFYPQYARNIVPSIIASSLKDLSNILTSFINDKDLNKMKSQYPIYENKFIANINKFNRYLDEAEAETKKCPLFIKRFNQVMIHTKRIYRLVSVYVFHVANEQVLTKQEILTTAKQINDILIQLEQSLLMELNKVDANCYLNLIATIKSLHLQTKLQENYLTSDSIFKGIFKELELILNEVYELHLLRLKYRYT